ncbi:2,4-dichlorophenol 6-monooxygenase isoform X1 [Cinnamomum micranthum f. kanehirae]|uniref:2,4-dichlorophenol 6-monooxygenase isoform X1 n=1 Tax=Cinnamomum micranthum f. kanehirae TaxID=337451 RepID=A0A443Q1J5_9MAGN|nr:2,4-dichlorophenol 6-monooxygenase isoform X1 [Cinnamomum micranthum f. kanehirae]
MGVFRSIRRWNGVFPIKTNTYPFEIRSRRSFSDAQNMVADDEILPVLIVGAGPVGLVLSILLTKLGIKCSVLEKSMVFSQHPQAHFINNRTVEVFRKMGGLVEEICKLQPPVDLWRKFIYCSSLSGYIFGSVDHMQPQDLEQVASPVSVAHFSQYKLTRLLLKQLENLNFHVHTCDGFQVPCNGSIGERKILMGHECVSITPTACGVMVGASFLKEGRKQTRNIHCHILVGSDGAGSAVRKLVGINMKGERDLQKLVSIHFLSRDLGQYLLHQRPGMLFFIFNPEAIGVLVAHDLNQGEFVLQMPFYPPQQNLEDFSSKVCKELILKLVGEELADVDVRDVKPWIMHAEVAEKFASFDNRVFLAGDAAHRFPPAGGFGMNTGIQDAHNLAWKIASVVNGIASPSILRTYELERKPIALFNTALSVQNFKAAMSVPAALGLDPTVANSVHQVINSAVGSILPSGMQKEVLESIFALGRAQLAPPLLNEKNPIGSARLAKLKSIFEEGKSLQLQFPAEDLGFRYLEGALVPEISDISQDTTEVPTGRRRDYIPSSEPGSRLPHMNVRVLKAASSEGTLSTLDLVCGEKLEFLLIIAPLRESYDLAVAAFKVAEQFKVSIKVCVMWPQSSFDEQVGGSKASLEPYTNYIDVEEVKRSSSSPSWWEMCQMTNGGAILVRPDEHIAWRVKSEVVADSAVQMETVFSLILGMRETHT